MSSANGIVENMVTTGNMAADNDILFVFRFIFLYVLTLVRHAYEC